MSELEKLKAQNAELADRIAKLEEANKPAEPFVPFVMPRFEPTEGMSMSREAMQRMAAVDDPQGRAADLRAFQQQQRSVAPQPSSPQRPPTPNWIPERPLESPAGSGQKYIDAIVDSADRSDLVETARKLAAAEIAMREATKKEAGNDK